VNLHSRREKERGRGKNGQARCPPGPRPVASVHAYPANDLLFVRDERKEKEEKEMGRDKHGKKTSATRDARQTNSARLFDDHFRRLRSTPPPEGGKGRKKKRGKRKGGKQNRKSWAIGDTSYVIHPCSGLDEPRTVGGSLYASCNFHSLITTWNREREGEGGKKGKGGEGRRRGGEGRRSGRARRCFPAFVLSFLVHYSFSFCEREGREGKEKEKGEEGDPSSRTTRTAFGRRHRDLAL